MSLAVLILDDSLTVRMDLAEAFEAAGCEPTPVATAAEARAVLARTTIDIVILDVVLPDGDGVDFLREIRARETGADVAVLMLSTEADLRDRVRGLSTGADEYVGKPYDTRYVVARAQELAQSRGTDCAEVTTVLIIDDSATFREELRAACERAGYNVMTATNGDDGLRLAASRRPSAVIVDGVLPGIDGATVIRRLRLDAALRGTPCLLLTGSEDRGAELRAFDAGADAFVRKEQDITIILAKLGALTRRGAHSTPADATASLLGPKKILAVDDSQTYLHEVAALLRDEGYDVVLARSGEEALELLGVQVFDCILLDVLMPGLGGLETCRRIKTAKVVRDVPLIMLTALEDREAMIEALGAGADDYIQKTSEFEVLTARVRAQLRRKQFEEENRRIREELLCQELEVAEADRANRAKSEFLSRMSHELRTPLTAIVGFSQLLRTDDLTTEQLDSATHISRAARHLLDLINELLDISQIESGRLSLSPEPVRLDDIVEEAVMMIEPIAATRGVRIVDLRPAGEHHHVLADRQRLCQVLINLLANAVKYNHDDGEVRISAEPVSNARLRMTITDTGLGIAGDDLGRLFQPFERFGAMQTEVQGTGLGLALTKGLVEAMGGSIGATSALGKGTTFWIELDLLEAKSGTLANASGAGALQVGIGPARTVLCIDDNAANLTLVERVVARRPGVELITAMRGHQGLEIARERRPAVILLDINLPDISGEEILLRLRADPRTISIPVIVVSGDATQANITALLAAGATGYLTKPYDINHLLALIDDPRLEAPDNGIPTH